MGIPRNMLSPSRPKKPHLITRNRKGAINFTNFHLRPNRRETFTFLAYDNNPSRKEVGAGFTENGYLLFSFNFISSQVLAFIR